MRYLFMFLICCFVSLNVLSSPYDAIDGRAKIYGNKYVNNLDKLTDELVRPYQHNQKATARVIFAWIVHHIQYDSYEAKTSYENRNAQKYGYNHQQIILREGNNIYLDNYNNTPHDVFKSRLGVCRDIARLFVYMARRAGLDAVVVSGRVHDKENGTGGHAWNAVLINKKWYLLDATWASKKRQAMTDIESDEAYVKAVNERRNDKQKLIKKPKKQKPITIDGETYIAQEVTPKKLIDNKWFLTPPEEMIKTHTPLNKQWTLLPPEKLKKPKMVNGIAVDRLLYNDDYNKIKNDKTEEKKQQSHQSNKKNNIYSQKQDDDVFEEEGGYSIPQPSEVQSQGSLIFLDESNPLYKEIFNHIQEQSANRQKTDTQDTPTFNDFMNFLNNSIKPTQQNTPDKKSQSTQLNIPSLTPEQSQIRQKRLEHYQKFFNGLQKLFFPQQ